MHTTKGSATDHSFGDQSKPSLHLIEPGTAGGREMEVKAAALFPFAPALDLRAFVRAVVVQDEVHLQIRWNFLFQLAQELNEFPPPMTRQTASDDFPVQDVDRRKKRGRAMPR